MMQIISISAVRFMFAHIKFLLLSCVNCCLCMIGRNNRHGKPSWRRQLLIKIFQGKFEIVSPEHRVRIFTLNKIRFIASSHYELVGSFFYVHHII